MLQLISELEKMKNQLRTIRIDAKFPHGLTKPYTHTTQDVILATAKVGLDYVQLWNSVMKGNKTTDEEGISSISKTVQNEIKIQKFEDLFQSHKTLYNNQIYEVTEVSNILFKAAILNMS
jgi:hypothetical protein